MTSRRLSMRRGRAGTIVLCGTIGVGVLGAAASATSLLQMSAPAVTAAAPNGARPVQVAAADDRRDNPLWAVPLSLLTATRERPIFSSSRRPPAAPVVAVASPRAPLPKPSPPAPQRPSLVLVGTVTSSAGGMAVFTDTATNAVVRLRTSEGHAGWILRAVSEREARLQKDGETAVLALPRRDSASAATPDEPARIPLPALRRP
jgi:hypothetical protein